MLPQSVGSFDGASSYINLGTNVYPTSGLPTAITVSAWINSPSSSTQAIIKKTNSGSNINGFLLGESSNKLAWYIYTNSWQGTWAFTSGTLNNNAWYFVACTWDGANMRCYINGVQDPSTLAVSGTLSVSNDPTYIGMEPLGSNNFHGLISNVQIYNTSLDAGSIQTLYSEGIGGAPQALNNIVGWWPLNGDTNDYSGNNNNGAATSVAYPRSWTNGYQGH
jgi:hypothetical protein